MPVKNVKVDWRRANRHGPSGVDKTTNKLSSAELISSIEKEFEAAESIYFPHRCQRAASFSYFHVASISGWKSVSGKFENVKAFGLKSVRFIQTYFKSLISTPTLLKGKFLCHKNCTRRSIIIVEWQELLREASIRYSNSQMSLYVPLYNTSPTPYRIAITIEFVP